MVCFILGCVGGLFTIAMCAQMRQSIKFWAAAKELNEKIPQTKTRDELRDLVKEFWDVNKMASGTPHWDEMRRIKTRIEDREAHLKELASITHE